MNISGVLQLESSTTAAILSTGGSVNLTKIENYHSQSKCIGSREMFTLCRDY